MNIEDHYGHKPTWLNKYTKKCAWQRKRSFQTKQRNKHKHLWQRYRYSDRRGYEQTEDAEQTDDIAKQPEYHYDKQTYDNYDESWWQYGDDSDGEFDYDEIWIYGHYYGP